ncbi:hypothetical protein ACFVYA_07505 [Amycolatopsis sp. NPDC058278]|uniref:hypothetical protein n=1 Tax=Amycolatopsis sp. NPDC058278 TaxID=3346417 RepID=UPI0036D8E79F
MFFHGSRFRHLGRVPVPAIPCRPADSAKQESTLLLRPTRYTSRLTPEIRADEADSQSSDAGSRVFRYGNDARFHIRESIRQERTDSRQGSEINHRITLEHPFCTLIGVDMPQNQDRESSPSTRAKIISRILPAKRRGLIGLTMIGGVSIAILIWAWLGNPANSTLRYEAAKTAMQAISVALLGGLAGLATFTFQQDRTEEAQRQARQRDVRLEQWRRDVENLRDERARKDSLLQSLLQETLTAYNDIKRMRRTLAAATIDGAGGHITLDIYDRHIGDLIVQQLEFEKFKRRLPSITDERLRNLALNDHESATQTRAPGEQLEMSYKIIEKYLNEVIDEYKDRRHVVVQTGPNGASLAEFVKLSGFIRDDFATEVSSQIDVIIELLQKALLQPLVLPEPVES